MTGYPTWSPGDLSGISLSNGNLTATQGGTANGAVRASARATAGLYYCETLRNGGSGGNFDHSGFGLADAGQAIGALAVTPEGGPGAIYCELAWLTGSIWLNGVKQVASCNAGGATAMLVDTARALVYWRANAADPEYGWNGSAGWIGTSAPANPATGTAGWSIASLWGSGQPVYAMAAFVAGAAAQQRMVLYGDAAGWMAPAPVGFVALGGGWNAASDATGKVVVSSDGGTASLAQGAAAAADIFSTNPIATGQKVYFELGFDAITASGSGGVADAALANVIGVQGDGTAGSDGYLSCRLDTPQGLRLAVAIDRVTNQWWYRCLGADPVSGKGGIPYSAIMVSGTGAVLPFLWTNAEGAQFGLVTDPASFTGVVPAGAVPWPPLAPAPDVFAPPDAGWSVTRERLTQTRIATAATGRRWRSALRQYPTIRYTLTFEALTSAAAYQGLASQSWQYVEGFLVDHLGPFAEFLFQDIFTPDYQVTGGTIGIGDGATTSFTFSRALRNTHEPVGWVSLADVSGVWVNGTLQSGNWSVTAPNILSFTTPPAVGAVITASFAFYWRCSFSEDSLSQDEFMSGLFELKELEFETLPSATPASVP